jgi:hypothetical protein
VLVGAFAAGELFSDGLHHQRPEGSAWEPAH